jgi:pilus assembly protein FimV
MQKKRLSNLILPLVLACTAFDAAAMGFVPVAPSTVLGQALDHVIGLRLEPGESLSPECVAAEVTVGETRLPAAAVRARIEGTGDALSVRVATTVAIDEPLVALTLAVGCPARLQRRFVLFADPVATAAPSAPVPVPVESVVPDPAPVAVPAAEERPTVQPTAPVRPRMAPAADASAGATAATPAAPRPRRVTRRAPTPASEAAPTAARERPRLRLDAAEPAPALLAAEMIQAAASAAAAQAAAEAASAAAQRIASLEQAIERMRADAAADREALRVLRQRASDADAQAQWMPWLLGLLAVLALLCGWLYLKLRRLQAEREQAWWKAAQGGAAAAPAAVASTVTPTVSGADTLAAAGPPSSSGGYISTRPGTLGPVFTPDPALADDAALSAAERTQALPVGWREDAEAPRDVSIEELIDLEQQAEFFIVLGQEDAAIDLLVDHLRSTGGGSPMPYLKLLEIYRRRGDREAYDRTRARFNHRFNAYAPDWDDDPSLGRSLEDYPSIVVRLQQAWPSPIDAMAELESLLFRKTRGELFDMPAYRDVMFLYSLARDLLDREPLESGNVDVLLPINEGVDRTQPMSLDDLPPPEDSGMVPLDQPTVPVDLDVTQPVIPESLFGDTGTDPGTGGNGRRRRSSH